jgi:hypothetical protein
MEESILTSTKKVLGIHPDDDSFDHDIITHINSAFSNLQQLGIGPSEGFVIVDEEPVWEDFIDGPLPVISQLKICIFLRVRMLFDPPTTSYLLGALEKQIQEHEWRLNTLREETDWIDPDPPTLDEAA